MISNYRKLFNAQFTEKKYQELKDDIASDFDYEPTFRVGNAFYIWRFKEQLIEGCNDVIAFIKKKSLKINNRSLE
jgi:uncharacterized protein CbrC (UPF0167 family)